MGLVRRFLTGPYESDAALKPGIVDRGDLPTLVKRDGSEVALEDLGNGGSQPALAQCLVARETPIDVHALGHYNLDWTALYDNGIGFNSIGAIPAGLGLSFLFDGSDGTVTATEDGVWALTLSVGTDVTDATWVGFVTAAVWTHEQITLDPGGASHFAVTTTEVVMLSAGDTFQPFVLTETAATADPFNLAIAYLAIIRIR